MAALPNWARALGEDGPDKVLPLYSEDAVLWGTLSSTVRADRAALRDYVVTAFKVLPSLKVTFGDQLIRIYDATAVNTRYYTFPTSETGNQDLAGALQLHLGQAGGELAHCRSSFFGNATGA